MFQTMIVTILVASIGALMRDGKKTQEYAAGEITDVYEYVLLSRGIQ